MTQCCSYSAPQTSYSAYIAPSDHKVPSLTYTFPLTQEAETESKYEVRHRGWVGAHPMLISSTNLLIIYTSLLEKLKIFNTLSFPMS